MTNDLAAENWAQEKRLPQFFANKDKGFYETAL